jgi:hypothetical protein
MKCINRVNNHLIRIILDDGTVIIRKERDEDTVSRIDFKMDLKGYLPLEYKGRDYRIPIVMADKSDVSNLPPLEEGTINVVSTMVGDYVKRPDCLSPDTTIEGIIQNGTTKVFAVKRLQCFTELPDWVEKVD